MAKGGEFERDVCYRLTRWWMGPKYDGDVVFWRTHGSGARATVRQRKGKSTKLHCGDIESVDDVGKPLTKLITFELKNGYQTATLHDLLDRLHQKEQPYEGFIYQAWTASERAGTPYWAIVHHRRMREAIITIPGKLATILDLSQVSCSDRWVSITVPNRWATGVEFCQDSNPLTLISLPFEEFLDSVAPAEIKRISPWREYQRVLKS